MVLQNSKEVKGMGQRTGKRKEKRREHNRLVYETLHTDPRIHLKDLSKILRVNRNAATRILREAFEDGYVLKPQVRKRSYANLKEYVYFVNCPYPHGLYKEYSENTHVSYHAVMAGFANMWVVSNEEIDIEGDVIVKGVRSDYHVPLAPDQPWKRAMQKMLKKVEDFNPDEYESKGTIKTHWHEPVAWDEEDEAMYREFKYNGREPLTPIMKKHLISSDKIYKFLRSLPERCTVFTRYFPKSIMHYDSYLFMFQTDYEDFIIDVFSELPTPPISFKVSDVLFLYANVDRSSVRRVGLDMYDVSQLHIPLLVDNLLQKGAIKRASDSIVKYAWQKNL
jgi:hypothetical protein